MTKLMMRTTPRRVNFLTNKEDLQTAVLGSLGFSTIFIQKMTSLTNCQIAYRLRKANIRRMDYRNGITNLSHRVFSLAQNEAAQDIKVKTSGKLKGKYR